MNKRLRVALLLLAAVLVSVIGVVELRHRVLFGHFTTLALHADVSVANGDIGIPGITKLYAAHITNFGIFPRRIERCEFLTDAFAPGVRVGYHLQQLDVASGSWHTAMDAASEYCRPYPLGIIKAQSCAASGAAIDNKASIVIAVKKFFFLDFIFPPARSKSLEPRDRS